MDRLKAETCTLFSRNTRNEIILISPATAVNITEVNFRYIEEKLIVEKEKKIKLTKISAYEFHLQ